MFEVLKKIKKNGLRKSVLKLIDWINRPWVRVEHVPVGHGTTFGGDPEAIDASDFDSIHQWGWIIFQIEGSPVNLYTISGTYRGRYLYELTEYVALRIGNRDVEFIAVDNTGLEVRMRKIIFPVSGERFSRADVEKQLKARNISLSLVTWA